MTWKKEAAFIGHDARRIRARFPARFHDGGKRDAVRAHCFPGELGDCNPTGAQKKAPAIAGRRLEMNPLPRYSGAGVAFGFFTTFLLGVGVEGAGGTPGTA